MHPNIVSPCLQFWPSPPPTGWLAVKPAAFFAVDFQETCKSSYCIAVAYFGTTKRSVTIFEVPLAEDLP